jgi:O-methyltransferase domain/Dimerisation domain
MQLDNYQDLAAHGRGQPNDARASLLRLINGFQCSQAVHVAASLGLPDLLASGAATADQLAARTRTHAPSLHRLLRALAAVGVLHEERSHRFSLTPIGEFLRSDVAGTHASMALMIGQSSHWRAWGELLHAVRTGTTAFDHVHGSNVWTYREKHPGEARIFDQAMAAGTERFAEAVIDVRDFSNFQTVIDVGGGDGIFIAKILAVHPGVRGILFDQPHVAMQAATLLERLGLSARCQALGGNFFEHVPEGGDAYLLKWILHDWDDTASIDILRSCRRSMKSSSRLFVVEHVIGTPNTSADGKFMDLNMMVMTGGRERTHDEFAALFVQAGFRVVSVTPTVTPLSLIEGALANP